MKILRTDPDRFGIRARLLTLLLPATLGLLALDSWNDYRALRNQVQDAYDQAMLESAKLLRDSLSLSPDGSLRVNAPLGVQALFDAAGPLQKHMHVGLTPQGQAPARELTLMGESDLPSPPRSPLRPALRAPQNAGTALPARPSDAIWYDSHYREHPVRVLALQRQVVDGRGQAFDLLIQVAESTETRHQTQADALRQELIRDARMVLVMILLVWLGVTWSLQPLEGLRKSVLQNKGAELKPLDTSDVPHEVAPLVDAVNQHLKSYRDLLEQQSQFLADASHQLRTPLAIMMTQAGFALREKNPQQLHKTLRAIVTQIARSTRLCEQLLSLAHASDSAPPADVAEVIDLNTIAKDVVLQHLSLAHEKNQDLGWVDAREQDLATKTTEDEAAPLRSPAALAAPVLARGPELHEALSNLVHNAIAHTPRGGHITVTVSTREGTALAEVCDNGPGIAIARRATVFERFHSAESTGKSSRGSGLGLSIARAYARRNGGDIALADADIDSTDAAPRHAGLRAILSLPLASDPQG